MNKKRIIFFAKLAISFGIVGWLYSKVLSRQGADALWQRLTEVSMGWVAFGFAMQVIAVICSITRWQRLLVGQGIHAPMRHLIGSFMIGRFFGEFAPGGWTGLNGYRIYDIAKHTNKLARATATIGIEMVLGWLSFGAVVVGGSLFGLRFIGVTGVALVDTFFIGLICTALLLVSKPRLFRVLADRLPKGVSGKLRTTVDAACAYEGKGKLVTQAALLGIATHFFRAFIYVAAAHALHADLSVGEVFFGSSLQVFATLMPASINGIGLREATAVALYTRVGVPEATAVLIPTLGFLIEMALSSFGGIVFMARRVGYQVEIKVEHAEHEELVNQAVPEVPEAAWPKPWRGLGIGLGAGLLAGALLGSAEAGLILFGSAEPDYAVLVYGTFAYALLLGAVGAGLGLAAAVSGRWLRREALPDHHAYGHFMAGLFSGAALAIGAFRIRRDYFHEELVWKSAKGLAILGGCCVSALLLFVVLSWLLRTLTARGPAQMLLRSWGSALCVVGLILLLGAARFLPHGSAHTALAARKPAPPQAGNVLFIVVDTLRADHLRSYAPDAVAPSPHLSQFAADAIRFDAAFANASWTRPSFASILSGRYPSSHRTMAKSDALPDEIITLPEALRAGGFATLGVVTNYNIAPFFNFHQGFDDYRYLEPTFVLGANDTAAKLLFVQFLRQRIETFRAKRGQVEVGSAYQDASVVNRTLLAQLDAKPNTPFFMFAAYMDPHDPYYPHPYDGTAYSRAAHQSPEPSEAPLLEKLYNGEISFWDEHFGALMAALKQRGLYDDLTIIVTADHGEEFQEHGGFWHGTTLYDEAVHVPLFMKLPGNQMHGSVVTHFVQSIDLMPTVLKLVGLPPVAGAQGHDVFEGNPAVFAEESHEGNVLRSLRLNRAGTTLKLITANPGNPRGLAPLELYRVDQDPKEQMNLAADEQDLTAFTQKALEQHAKDAAIGRASVRSVDLTTDPNAAARLRALGYAGGDKPK